MVVTTAMEMTAGTKKPDTVSAIFAIGALVQDGKFLIFRSQEMRPFPATRSDRTLAAQLKALGFFRTLGFPGGTLSEEVDGGQAFGSFLSEAVSCLP